MAKKNPRTTATKTVASHAALIVLSIIFLIPFIWMVSTSLKSETHMSSLTPEWIPRAEYVKTESGRWAEVLRNEIIEYYPVEKDEQGRPLPRRPKTSVVRLVDRWGDPLAEPIFEMPAGKAVDKLRSGSLSPALISELAAHDITLSEEVTITKDPTRDRWNIETEEATYIAARHEHTLRMSLDIATRTIDSQRIETKPWPTFRHYAEGLRAFRFPLYLQNTLFLAMIAVAGTVLSCSWVAFGFSILEWPGRNKVFYVMLGTLMLPPQVTMVPLFIIFKNLGWINTYKPLLVPAFMGSAFFIFLLRQFFLTIPKDLIDASRVDGCSTLRIYWQIVMPLSIPALATVALFTFMIMWNDFMGPLIYVVDEAKYTLSLGLAMFKGRFATRYGEMMAVSALLTLPIIVLFFFTQKTFIQGIKTSGMKG